MENWMDYTKFEKMLLGTAKMGCHSMGFAV